MVNRIVGVAAVLLLVSTPLFAAIDPKTHWVYAPEQEEDGKPVSRLKIFKPGP